VQLTLPGGRFSEFSRTKGLFFLEKKECRFAPAKRFDPLISVGEPPEERDEPERPRDQKRAKLLKLITF